MCGLTALHACSEGVSKRKMTGSLQPQVSDRPSKAFYILTTTPDDAEPLSHVRKHGV